MVDLKKDYLKNCMKKARKKKSRSARVRQNRIDKAKCKEAMRMEALRNVFQFHTFTLNDNFLKESVASVISNTSYDIERHNSFLNPKTYVMCSSCGLNKLPEKFKCIVEGEQLTEIKYYVHRMYYGSKCFKNACTPCFNYMKRKKKASETALCNGWSFYNDVPIDLSRLNKYEYLLKSLRLPLIYVWKAQGGFGQYASCGTPVAFSNPVANLVNYLPRDPKIVFKNILQSGIEVKISAFKVKCALKWFMKNNYLYKNVLVDNAILNEMESNFPVTCKKRF